MKQQFLSKRTFIFFAVPILLICIAGLFPLFQHFIVDATSDFMKRRLDADWWMPRIKIYSTMVISAILAIYFFAYTKYGCEIFSGIKREFAELFGSLKKRENRRFFIFIFSVFIVGIFTIIRANYSYIDDMGRATQGYNHLDTWSRFLAGALAMLIHASPRLMDISPLPQISACLILAFGAFVFAYIATEKKVTWLSCIAALPIGLSAYFLENLTFKFDAPYMALAVVFGIVPFLFVNNKKAFSAASILGLLGTCFTYQSASGVYIVLTIFFAFLFYCEKSWDIKKNFFVHRTCRRCLYRRFIDFPCFIYDRRYKLCLYGNVFNVSNHTGLFVQYKKIFVIFIFRLRRQCVFCNADYSADILQSESFIIQKQKNILIYTHDNFVLFNDLPFFRCIFGIRKSIMESSCICRNGNFICRLLHVLRLRQCKIKTTQMFRSGGNDSLLYNAGFCTLLRKYNCRTKEI